MKIIDLTHTIKENMPVYPGTDKPRLIPGATYETDGFKETVLTMFSHTGTHMDAPSHIYAGKAMLDSFCVSRFIGSALVIDCTAANPGITYELIRPVIKAADKADFLLFNTGWDLKWNTEEYFNGFPYLTESAADYIIKSGKKGVGTDAISIDKADDISLKMHKKLFESSQIVIIENLTNLSLIGGGIFTLYALPLKFENSDGAPVRAVAVLYDNK